MTRKPKATPLPPEQEERIAPPENIFRDLCEHWTIGTLVKQAYEAIHTEESISPVELVLGTTVISAYYDDSDEKTYITVSG